MRQSSANSWVDRARRLITWRGATAIAIAVLVGAGLLTVRVSSGGEPGSTDAWMTVAIVALLAMVVFVGLGLVLQLAGVDSEAPAIAQHLSADPQQQRLLQRWLERARWARFVGGLAGLLVWFLGTMAKGDILMFGSGGIAIGAVFAEMHHIRRAGGPRTARVQVRGVSDYLLERDARWMIGVGAVALVAAATGARSADTRAATWWGLGSCAALGLARLAQHRVVTRGRPAVSESLTRADDLARELAIGRGLARPATFFALALVARSCFALEPTIGDVARVLGVAAWITAFVLWWQNRRLGLDFLTSGQRNPVLP
ncbi:MAG: hypothetical protein ABI949_17180 [Ilumatobacteraceae bacterium]